MTHNSDDLRKKNLETVRHFMTLTGPERLEERNKIATPDARLYARLGANKLAADGERLFDRLDVDIQPAAYDFRDWNRESCEEYPGYGPHSYEIYETENPNRFIARCEAKGHRRDGTPVIFRFFYAFLMQDGLIRVFEENWDDLIHLYDADGVEYGYAESNA